MLARIRGDCDSKTNSATAHCLMLFAPTLPRSSKLSFPFLQAAVPCYLPTTDAWKISHSFLLLTRAGDGRSNYRDLYLLVDVSEIALRLHQAWEMEGPCCSGHTLDSPWSFWLPAQKHCLWLKALLGQSATKSFVGMAELQMIPWAFINSAFALLKRPRSISSS